MPLGAARITLLAFQPTVEAEAEVLRQKVGVTAVGDAQIDTAQSQFGGGSALFDGVDDALTVGDSSLVFTNTDTFTIECWVNRSAGGDQYKHLYSMNWFDTNDRQATLLIDNNNRAAFYWNATGGSVGDSSITATTSMTAGTWYHVAVTCDGSGNLKLYVNGTQEASATGVTINSSALGLDPRIGATAASLSGGNYSGYIDEFRVSNTARYTTGFTPSTTPFVNDANTLLLLHMDGRDATTFFEDDNGVNRVKGNGYLTNQCQIDTAQYKFGGASALGDGSGDLALYPAFPAIGTGEFTAECWLRFTDADGGTIFDFDNSFGSGPLLYYRSDEKIDFFYNGAGINVGSTVLSPNTWYHIALTRESDGYTRVYINGTLDSTSSSPFTTSIGAGLRVGDYSAAAITYTGHIDEVRISNVARYTANFTPQEAPFVNDASTLLLSHFNGTDGSQDAFDDNGYHTAGRTAVHVSPQGNAQVDTAQSQFGGSSLALLQSTDQLLVNPFEPDFTGDFTVECWVRLTAKQSYIGFLRFYDDTTFRFQLSFESNNDYGFLVYSSGSGIVLDAKTGGLSYTNTNVDQWYHLALCRSNGVLRWFVDGVARESTTSNVATSINNLQIGSTGDDNCYIDEVRISSTARYTANFTAPTEPFVDDANTLLLLHMDGADGSTVFTDDVGGRAPVGVRANGNAQVDTAQSQFGGASAYFSANGDNILCSQAVTPTTGPFTIEFWFRPPNTGVRYDLVNTNTTGNGRFYINTTTSSQFQAFINNSISGSSSLLLTSTTTYSANTWYHVAVIHDSNDDYYLYVNGNLEDSDTTSDLRTVSSAATIIGDRPSGFQTYGHIDEVRISNIARYTSAFTAPTAPFQNDANTLLLLHMDGTDGSTVFTDDNGVHPGAA